MENCCKFARKSKWKRARAICSTQREKTFPRSSSLIFFLPGLLHAFDKYECEFLPPPLIADFAQYTARKYFTVKEDPAETSTQLLSSFHPLPIFFFLRFYPGNIPLTIQIFVLANLSSFLNPSTIGPSIVFCTRKIYETKAIFQNIRGYVLLSVYCVIFHRSKFPKVCMETAKTVENFNKFSLSYFSFGFIYKILFL